MCEIEKLRRRGKDLRGGRWRFGRYALSVGEPAGRCLLESGVGALSQVAEDRGIERRVALLAAWGIPKLLFRHRVNHLFARHGLAGLLQNRQGRIALRHHFVGRFGGGRFLRRGRIGGLGRRLLFGSRLLCRSGLGGGGLFRSHVFVAVVGRFEVPCWPPWPTGPHSYLWLGNPSSAVWPQFQKLFTRKNDAKTLVIR